MPKGKKYGGGSRKGIPNKRTQQWEMFTEYCLSGGLEKFQQELNTLQGDKFVNAYLQLLEYHKPKRARVDENGDSSMKLITVIAPTTKKPTT